MLGVCLLLIVALTACFGVISLADPESGTTLGIAYLCAITTVSLVYDILKDRR